LGSPWAAAGSSFGAFIVGAIVPVIPYIMTHGPKAFLASAILSCLALFGVGALLSVARCLSSFRFSTQHMRRVFPN